MVDRFAESRGHVRGFPGFVSMEPASDLPLAGRAHTLLEHSRSPRSLKGVGCP